MIKNNKNITPFRQRKRLIAWRWCFFIFFTLAIFIFAFFSQLRLGLFWRIVAWSAVAVWLIVFVQVLYCKFFFPIVTPLMIHRYFQQRKTGNTHFEWSPVSIDTISPHLINAVDVAENSGLFLYDRGFLFRGLSRAYSLNKKGTALYGGSTISQQTAKNCFLPHSRTMLRKVLEAYYTLLIELFWGKKRIMECYLNIIEYGNGIYGCEAASQHYYHHSSATLTEDEAIMLAVSLAYPLRANPENHTSDYDSRVDMVKRKLQVHNPINWEDRVDDLNPDLLNEGNRGLFFFIKWLFVKHIRPTDN